MAWREVLRYPPGILMWLMFWTHGKDLRVFSLQFTRDNFAYMSHVSMFKPPFETKGVGRTHQQRGFSQMRDAGSQERAAKSKASKGTWPIPFFHCADNAQNYVSRQTNWGLWGVDNDFQFENS